MFFADIDTIQDHKINFSRSEIQQYDGFSLVLVVVVMVLVLPIVRASATAIAIATRAINPREMSILARRDKPLDLFEE